MGSPHTLPLEPLESLKPLNWFGSFEAGALFTGRSFPDKCFTFSVGYRF